MDPGPQDADAKRVFARERRMHHPPLLEAIVADAQVTAAHRGERSRFRSRADALAQSLRLAWTSDAFCAQVLYRLQARLQAAGMPVLPRLAHRLAMATAQVSIGDPVVVEPGVYIVHGQVVIDGITRIGSGAVISPFVTIGLKEGNFVGPTLDRNVAVGSGARVLGPVRIGAGARIGANAVVIDDVPEGSTAVGVPARPSG